MSYRVDIPTLSANEVYTLTFEYEGTETIQLIVGDLTLETTDRRVVFTTTSPVYYIESNMNLTNLNNRQIEAVQTTEPPTEQPTTVPVYDSFVPTPDGMTEKTQLWLRDNKDYIGWIRIKNTYVDYPILKDPGEVQEGQPYYKNEHHDPNSFYLYKNFDRNYEFAGSLFMDYRNNFGGDENAQSENIMIYGLQRTERE